MEAGTKTMVGVMVPVGTGDGGTTGLTSAFSPATPDDVTPTTPSALWEAITPGSDYKALMNTHTHTLPGASHILR